MIANVFRAFLTTKLEAGGSETTISLDRVTTLTGETISTSDFADFSRGIITVNPDGDGVTSFPEYMSFTAVSGLTLTGAVRGLSAKSNSVVAANKRFHPAGTPVILSFGSHVIQDLLDYIDAQIGALTLGANIVSTGTAGEILTAGQLVYLKNDGKWWKTDADTAATLYGVILGICQSNTAADATITSGVLQKGLDTNQSGLVAGTEYFASNTAGAIATSAGTNSKKVGVARSTTNLYFDPNYGELPSGGEKAAMAGGSTFGTPSGTNKFITQDYNASATGVPVVRTYLNAASPATWTKPTGLKYVIVEVQAAGGTGGAGDTSGGAGGGGGAGGYARKLIAVSALGATETVTIGAPGANSSFGVHVSATSGGNGGNAAANADGGIGGTGSSGDINVKGQGGSGGGPGAAFSGQGGNSFFGGGARGLNNQDGEAGGNYGGGGSGSHDSLNGGFAGGPAIVIVTEYYS